MSISIWDLFKYLYKWKIVIILVTVLSFLAASVYVDKHQTYSAKVVIQYNDKCISGGKTLDGELFDSNEIKSPRVILNVLKELGYSNKKIESVREHISIAPITPKSVESLREAKQKLGEEYHFYPKTFAITYHGNSSQEATRNILTSIVENYFKYYSETYLYLASLNEVDYSVNQMNFDYIEQAEQIDENLKQTIESLSSYSRDSRGYRAPATGMTFDDLLKEFQEIQDFSMPKIFSKIYKGQVTQNKDLLLSKYRERLESYERDMNNFSFKANIALDRMSAYENANKNASQEASTADSENSVTVMQGIEHDADNSVDKETTYDDLITSYSNDSVAANNKKVDMEYCQYIIDQFTGPKANDVNYEEYESEVKTSIAQVLERLEELYKQANINISSYNSYIPALHIKKLSGVNCSGNISGSVYELIAIIGGFSLSCLMALTYEIMKKYALYAKIKEENGEDNEEIKETEE